MPSRSALAETIDRVRFLVAARRLDVDNRQAIADTARDLGIAPRRLRAILYEEAKRLYAEEFLRIRERYDALVEREAQRLEARAALLRARRMAPPDGSAEQA